MYLIAAIGSVVMGILLLRSIGTNAVALAYGEVSTRRTAEARRKAEDAAAEALGRAAAQEPLALNADGTIAEPIIGIPENA
jgi:hypothetical protein